MSAYRLAKSMHFCEIGDQRVFLDLAGDRYFSLPPDADAALLSLMEADQDATESGPGIDFLIGAGILVATLDGKPVAPTRHRRPTRSLLEETTAPAGRSVGAFVEAWLLVQRARRAISKKQLPRLLKALAHGRSLSAAMPAMNRDRALAQFRAVRRFIPAAPNCLYDSLALCRFLQRRGIVADLVIGAKLHPFGAHCWLQDGDILLNDSVAVARDFEPVLVA